MNLPYQEEIYSPSSMTLYGLCRSILFAPLDSKDTEIYSWYIIQKIQPYINEVKRYVPKRDHPAFESYLKSNIIWFCKKCFNEGDSEFLNSHNSEFGSNRNREVNNQILQGIMRRNIGMLFREKYQVFSDYKTCHAVINGNISFSVFQKKYGGIIGAFAKRYCKTFNIDFEDMKQELEITMWKCIQGYTGQNFSRFSTYLKQSLKNKVKDMYRAKFADKRIIDLYTRSYNEGEGESYIGSLVNSVVYSSWTVLNREHDAKNNEESPKMQRGYQSSYNIQLAFPRNA